MSDYEDLGHLFTLAVEAANGVRDVQDAFDTASDPDPVKPALQVAEVAFRAVAERCKELLARRA